MIVDKTDNNPLPDDLTPAEAPPSYAYALQGHASTSYSSGPKAAYPTISSPTATAALFSTLSKKQGKPYKAKSRWFFFWNVKDGQADSRDDTGSTARSCQAMPYCRICEPFIEGHMPVYWAIVKRPTVPAKADRQNTRLDTESDALVMALLTASSPITPATISEVRLGCLHHSDHWLFQHIKQHVKEFSQLTGTDEMLLEDSGDLVAIEEVPGDASAFIAKFELVHFQLRMRVSKRVEAEFIAKGRLWCLSFFISPNGAHGYRPGSWLISLTLLEHSPPTWIDSRLIVAEPSRPQTTSVSNDSSSSPFPSTPSRLSLPPFRLSGLLPPPQHPSRDPSPRMSTRSQKPKPTINLRIKSGSKELVPKPLGGPHEIVVPLEDSTMGANLQYEGSPYIDSLGTLNATLQVQLRKPDSDCVIC
ncbi:hypothetical protein EW146_g2643 [Bondarzewia mesenterica]|uniref:Uncharacterized protein n=1 Tax=Bondarzewia mesenterica TaxID=1095465 RepID=A0A4S4M047_9AGAM|nr:hypothetical protein EW146_g2643 [Bondarzewia mesenterica]